MFSPKRAQNSRPAKEMTCRLELGKRKFLCPFALIKANPWDRRDQLWDFINIITPLGAEKTHKGIKNQTAKTRASESPACQSRIWIG